MSLHYSRVYVKEEMGVNSSEYDDAFKALDNLSRSMDRFSRAYSQENLNALIESSREQNQYENKRNSQSGIRKAFSSKPKVPYQAKSLLESFNELGANIDFFNQSANLIGEEPSYLLNKMLDSINRDKSHKAFSIVAGSSDSVEGFRVILRQYEGMLRAIG